MEVLCRKASSTASGKAYLMLHHAGFYSSKIVRYVGEDAEQKNAK